MSFRLATSPSLRRLILTATCLVLRPPCRTVSLMHAVLSEKKATLNKKLKGYQAVPDYDIVKMRERLEKGSAADSNKEIDSKADENVLLELWNDSPRSKIGVMDLSSAKKHHIRPGFMLAPFVEMEEEPESSQPTTDTSVQHDQDDRNADNSHTQLEDDKGSTDKRIPKYLLREIVTNLTATKKKAFDKGRGVKLFYKGCRAKILYKGRGAKLLYLRADKMKDSHFTLVMGKAYEFVFGGIHVEFHIIAGPRGRIDTSSTGRSYTGKGFINGVELGQFDLKNEENLAKLDLHPDQLLHLRPDVILQALPEGSYMAIRPRADYQDFAWVIGPPGSTEQNPEVIAENNQRRLDLKLNNNIGRRGQIVLERLRFEQLTKEFEPAATEDSAENRLEFQDTCMQREAVVEKPNTRFSGNHIHEIQALRGELAEELAAEKEVQDLNADPRLEKERWSREAIASVTPIPATVTPIQSGKETGKQTAQKKLIQKYWLEGAEELSKADWKRLRLYENIKRRMQKVRSDTKKFRKLQARAEKLAGYSVVKGYLERHRPAEPLLKDVPRKRNKPMDKVDNSRSLRKADVPWKRNIPMDEVDKSKSLRKADVPWKRNIPMDEVDKSKSLRKEHARSKREIPMGKVKNSKIQPAKTEVAHKQEDSSAVKIRYTATELKTFDALQSTSNTQSHIRLLLKNNHTRFEPQPSFSTTIPEAPRNKRGLYPVVPLRLVQKSDDGPGFRTLRLNLNSKISTSPLREHN